MSGSLARDMNDAPGSTSTTSTSLSSARNTQGSTHERLYRSASRGRIFRSVNPATRYDRELSSPTRSEKDIKGTVDRLHQTPIRRRYRTAREISSEERVAASSSFRPKISARSRTLAKRAKSYNNMSPRGSPDVFERLTSRPPQRRVVGRQIPQATKASQSKLDEEMKHLQKLLPAKVPIYERLHAESAKLRRRRQHLVQSGVQTAVSRSSPKLIKPSKSFYVHRRRWRRQQAALVITRFFSMLRKIKLKSAVPSSYEDPTGCAVQQCEKMTDTLNMAAAGTNSDRHDSGGAGVSEGQETTQAVLPREDYDDARLNGHVLKPHVEESEGSRKTMVYSGSQKEAFDSHVEMMEELAGRNEAAKGAPPLDGSTHKDPPLSSSHQDAVETEGLSRGVVNCDSKGNRETSAALTEGLTVGDEVADVGMPGDDVRNSPLCDREIVSATPSPDAAPTPPISPTPLFGKVAAEQWRCTSYMRMLFMTLGLVCACVLPVIFAVHRATSRLPKLT